MKVLFICKNNQFRSQMAAAIHNKLTDSNNAGSAGTYVGSDAVPEDDLITKHFRTTDFFEVMEEHGMNIRNSRTRKLTPGLLEEFDLIVSMAQEPFIPDFLKNNPRVVWWDIEDPSSVTRDVAESVYAEISDRVRELVASSTNN